AKAFLEPRNILSSRFARASPQPEGKMPPSPADRRSLRLLAAALAVFLTALQARTAGALQIQQAFASPSRTNNFLVDAVSRRVYLAAVNSLYQLNATLAREVETRTGPVLDNPLCHAPQLPQATCEHQKTLTDNHNKLLTLDRAQGVLLACGSVFQGFCELRAMDDASRLAVRFPQDGATVFPSMLNIAANHENASTVGLVFRSHGGAARLLVAATYTGMGSEYFPKNHSKEDLRFENTPEIAIRSLDIADIGRLFTYDINPSEDNVFKIKQEVKQKNKLSFVRAFVHKSYSYIAINNDANAGVKESQPNSILARICLDTDAPRRSAESRKLTESYIQMGLQCGSSGNIYSRLLSIYPADISSGGAAGAEPHLFGVFAQAGGRAAVCAFRVLEVEERLQPHDILFISLQEEQLNCGAAHLQHPLALRRPLRARPIYEAPGLSSIAVDNVHNRTVMFLGTSRGRLRKLSLLANLSMANQWSLKLASNEPVHHIMTFDPSDHNYLYLMTTHHVTVQVSACGQYSSCSECVSAGDAHCGWCTLERRCSVQKNCSSGTLGRSWISTGDGVQQCPSMTITPSEISRSDVGILINGSVPDLQGLQVECDYGVGITTNATVHLDYSTTQIQTCPLLPLHMYPTIPFDHVTVPMAIRVNGVSVVSGNFTIYECERTGQIHFKTACTSCLSTAWHCYWDPRLNLCVSSKESTPHTVSQACSVLILTQILSHTQTVPQACSVLMRSCARVAACVSPVHPQMALPDPDWVKAVLQTSGRASKDRCVMCVCVCVCVCAVEVYSCSAGDSDCSQCWGRQTQGHMCVWCDNSCQQRDQCHAITTRCPDLSSSKVEPLSGPLTGGTLLTVQGRNLGHSATQLNVSIGHVPCSVLPQYYTVSVRLLEFTPQQGPLAGGTRLTIHGQFLDAGSTVNVKINRTQNCTIFISKCWCVCVIFQSVRSFIQMSFPQICSCVSSTLIVCQSPATNQSQQATAHFYLNEVLYRGEDASPSGRGPDEDEEPHADAFHFDYVEDPQFYTANKEKLIKHHPGEPLILIINKGPSELDLTLQEYSVTIGSDLCDITFHNEQLFHCTINRSLSASTGELPVTVRVGHFQKVIAMVQMGGGSELAIIVSIVVCCVLLLLCTVALVVYCTKSRRAERDWQKTLLQMEEMESQIRDEIRKGFAELQTDMTDLTKELSRTQGIPFLEYKQFVTRTFFPKMCSDYERRLVQPMYENDPLGPRALSETHPLLQDWQSSNSVRPNLEEGITLFSTLLNNKHFLVTFVHALEQQKDFAVRDRCNLASLLTIALHGKLEYYTSIMKELLVDLIDASASKNPKLMLRRTESVVEKMLTNWMSICMYSYLKETVGEPFFLLLCAIKQQINKGSIDAITGKARYTLNEEWLLRENIEAKPQNINVSFQGFGMDSVSVRVMNTDTICQVKDKILEAFYKNLPFSQWPREEDVDLEWFPEGRSSRILQDLDNTSVMEDGRKKLNTVFHYQIPDGASLAMSMKDKRENTLGRVKDLDTEKYVHLVLPHDELTESRKSHRHSHRKKVLPEIYLTRLLSTKGTLQKFLDDLFQAILSIPPEKPPLAIKYFFDFLEEQADKRGITDPDTLHIWKTNSLPLRFWVNILKNPQFVFDIDKTDHMDACLSVIAQAFIDACSLSDLQLGKDSPTNKLLYAKEIPEYKKRVQCYYKQIQEMAPLSEQEMNAHLAEESRRYRNEFNTNLAVMEVYKYAKRYRNQVVSALDSSPTARRTQLQHKFEQVIALVEDNIYEVEAIMLRPPLSRALPR
uniref:Sema domain-containing protein n=1 Tax=Sinocyclocheilus rhinocerous TaxID=307959 RepID=A0A673J362_9TELE